MDEQSIENWRAIFSVRYRDLGRVNDKDERVAEILVELNELCDLAKLGLDAARCRAVVIEECARICEIDADDHEVKEQEAHAKGAGPFLFGYHTGAKRELRMTAAFIRALSKQ